MKIHVVQKGDTLWEISQKYGVDFEELKQLNSQLSSPDMIMPGMKIKVPSSSKTVKHETKPIKETKKEPVKEPYKDISPKPMPVIKEDDKKPPKEIKPEKPKMPKMPEMPVQPIIQMPILEQDFDYHTTVKFPQMPKQPEEKKEKPKPQPKPMPKPQPIKEEKKAVMPPQPMPIPMAPCYMVHPCFAPAPYPMMAPPFDYHAGPMQKHGKKDCGCQGTGMQYPQMMPYQMSEGIGNPPSSMAAPQQPLPQTGFTSQQQQQPDFIPAQPQQSTMYPPPLSPGMNPSYPSPPEYPQNYLRKDEDEKGNEE
ncbi:SafA/ExsA family spore coat assembly protein [Virgibacillus kimchii]